VATILIIDDSATHRAAIREALEPEAIFDRFLEAEDGFAGLKLLLKELVDVVLCDLELPGFDGEKLLRVKDQSPGGANIPFLFLTASQDVERRVRLLEDGACDALTKPFHPADLVARLRLHLKIKRLQDELRVKNETLVRLSTRDPVTGLRTRRYVSEVLSIEFLRARRYHSSLAVLMADLDHFKNVNDRYGHPAGDAVLLGVSELLLSTLRATDVAGRYGGEEILVLLSGNDLQGGVCLAERWRSAVDQTRFDLPDGRTARVQISVGVATYLEGMQSPEDLVTAADAALYRAKEAGRNLVKAAER
jgi:two-component system cell cycle response regulator